LSSAWPDVVATRGQPIPPQQQKITYISGILCRQSKIFAGVQKWP